MGSAFAPAETPLPLVEVVKIHWDIPVPETPDVLFDGSGGPGGDVVQAHHRLRRTHRLVFAYPLLLLPCSISPAPISLRLNPKLLTGTPYYLLPRFYPITCAPDLLSSAHHRSRHGPQKRTIPALARNEDVGWA